MNRVKMRSVQIAMALMAFCFVSAAAAASDQQSGQVVNINDASEIQLAYLPGIGATTAARIVAYREKRAFKKPLQLMRVKGIGRKTFQKIQSYISVSGPTTATAKIKIPKK